MCNHDLKDRLSNQWKDTEDLIQDLKSEHLENFNPDKGPLIGSQQGCEYRTLR